MKKNSVKQLTIAALLVAMGIVIPMVMPRITIGPASFTLASHVPLFIAMFFSPWMTISVCLGTSFGFLLSATPVIALRALSHMVFAVIGALFLKKYPTIVRSKSTFCLFNWQFQLYNFVIAVIHSVAECVVISLFYTLGNLPGTYYSEGYLYSILILMGIGGIVHSLIDYNIAYFIANALSKHFVIPVFYQSRIQSKK